jgi:hypothetical protein
MLALYEELAILLLDPTARKFPRSNPAAHYIIGASLLVELSIKKKISKDEEGTITLLDAVPTGDALLDKALLCIKDVQEKRTFRQWIQELGLRNDALSLAIASLESKNIILREREWRFIIPVTRWSFTNPGVQQSLKFRIALTDDASRNERIAGLISLVMAGEEALKHLFRPEEWDDLRVRFQQFIASNPIPPAVKDMMYRSGAGDDLTLIMLFGAMGNMENSSTDDGNDDSSSGDDGGAGDSGGDGGSDGGGGDGGGGSD